MSLAWHVILTKEMICIASSTCNDSKHQETLAISSHIKEKVNSKGPSVANVQTSTPSKYVLIENNTLMYSEVYGKQIRKQWAT